MSNAKTDQNWNPTLTAVSTSDGETPVRLEADPITGALVTSAGGQILTSNYDYVGMSNADGNGNYQTIVYKSGGSGGQIVATLTMTFDGSNNVTSITRS